jgi:hypothetical protein
MNRYGVRELHRRASLVRCSRPSPKQTCFSDVDETNSLTNDPVNSRANLIDWGSISLIRAVACRRLARLLQEE